MGAKSKIDWCDATFNPVTGCQHGCEYCYARRIAERFSTKNKNHVFTGGHPIGKIHELENPAIAIETGKKSPYPFGFQPTFHRYKLDEPQKWKKGRNIFVCSMADLFGDFIPDSWIEEVFAACEKAPQHNYLFLTKNPKRYEQIEYRSFLPTTANLWYGSTITAPTDKCFISNKHHTFWSIEPILAPFNNCIWQKDKITPLPDWIIIGAETGNRKDKVIPKREWIVNIVDECRKAEIPVFMKESLADIWGEPVIQEHPEGLRKEH